MEDQQNHPKPIDPAAGLIQPVAADTEPATTPLIPQTIDNAVVLSAEPASSPPTANNNVPITETVNLQPAANEVGPVTNSETPPPATVEAAATLDAPTLSDQALPQNIAGQVITPGETQVANPGTPISTLGPSNSFTPKTVVTGQIISQPIGNFIEDKKPKWYKRFRISKPVLIVIAAVILFGGGGAYAYFGYYVPNEPKNVVKAAIINLFDFSNSQAYTMTAVMKSIPASASGNTTVTFNGGADKSGNFRVDISTEISAFKISGSVIGRLDTKALYIKVDQLPSLLDMAASSLNSPDLTNLASTIGNNWLKISVNDVESAGLINATTAAKANTCVDAYANYVKDSQNALQTQITKAYPKNGTFNVTKVGSDTVGNQKMTKFKITINDQQAKTFMDTLGSQFEGPTKNLADKCDFSNTSNVAAKASSSTTADNLKVSNIYLWTDSKKHLGQITFSLSQSTSEENITITPSTTKLDTTTPTNIVTLKDLINNPTVQSLMSGLSSGL